MKKIISLLFVLMVLNIFSLSKSELNTIQKVAKKTGVPQKSLIKLVNKELEKKSDFIVNEDSVEEISKKFDENILYFAGKLALVGMVVVFVSLLVISAIVLQIKHFSNKKKPKKRKDKVVQTSIGAIQTTESDVSTNSIVAVITALHMHVQEVETNNKLNMNWSRAPVSMWKSVSKAKFPNQDFGILSGR